MLAHLADASVRSLLVALMGAMVVWFPWRRRTAAFEHAVWTAVVCGMLALFVFGQALPRLRLRMPDGPVVPASALRPVTVPGPIPPDLARDAAERTRAPIKSGSFIGWRQVALYRYWAIALALLARFAAGMLLVRKLLARANPVSCPGPRAGLESELIRIPLTVGPAVGTLRPRILLPLEWRDAVAGLDVLAVAERDGLSIRSRLSGHVIFVVELLGGLGSYSGELFPSRSAGYQ
jgi:hypothetical protein